MFDIYHASRECIECYRAVLLPDTQLTHSQTVRSMTSLYYPELDVAKTAEMMKINIELIEHRFKAKINTMNFEKDRISKFAFY